MQYLQADGLRLEAPLERLAYFDQYPPNLWWPLAAQVGLRQLRGLRQKDQFVNLAYLEQYPQAGR